MRDEGLAVALRLPMSVAHVLTIPAMADALAAEAGRVAPTIRDLRTSRQRVRRRRSGSLSTASQARERLFPATLLVALGKTDPRVPRDGCCLSKLTA
jgi:hypothetical protein